MRSRGELVDQPGEYFLARSALTQEQDRDVNVGHQRRLRANLAHRRTGRDEKHIIAELFHLAAERLLALPESQIEDRIQFRFLKWLGQLFFNDTATTEIYTLSLHDALADPA